MNEIERGATKDCIQVTLVLKEDYSLFLRNSCEQPSANNHRLYRKTCSRNWVVLEFYLNSLAQNKPPKAMVCLWVWNHAHKARVNKNNLYLRPLSQRGGTETNKRGIVDMSCEETNVENEVWVLTRNLPQYDNSRIPKILKLVKPQKMSW